MTLLIVGILIPALSFSIYALIHFWAEAHVGTARARSYSVVTIHSTSLPRQSAPERNTPVTIATRSRRGGSAIKRK